LTELYLYFGYSRPEDSRAPIETHRLNKCSTLLGVVTILNKCSTPLRIVIILRKCSTPLRIVIILRKCSTLLRIIVILLVLKPSPPCDHSVRATSVWPY